MTVLLGLVALAILLWAAQKYLQADPRKLAAVFKLAGGIALLAFAAFLGARGEIAIAAPLAAVGLGLLAALRLSGAPELREDVAALLAARGLPTRLEGADPDAVVMATARDKKRRGSGPVPFFGGAFFGNVEGLRARNGVNVAVFSVLGRTFMRVVDCPYKAAERVLATTAAPAATWRSTAPPTTLAD